MNIQTVPLSSVEFGERRREQYGDLVELAESIKQFGLLHAPVVVPTNDPARPYKLAAGGRRFQAIQLLEWPELPVHILDHEPSHLELREIELEENVKRKDLTWREDAALKKEIHELKQTLHGVSSQGSSEGWTLEDTASLVGKSKASVHQDLKIAGAVESFPQFFEGCKTKQDATKVMKMLEEQAIRQELARRAQQRVRGSLEQTILDSFIVRDFFEGVRSIPDGLMNMVEIDPPYAIQLHDRKQRATDAGELDNLAAYNEVPSDQYLAFMRRVFTECYRTMAENSWLVCWFASEPWFEPLFQELMRAGFTGSRQCGLWIKPSGQTLQPQFNLANAAEQFFYVRKGKPAIMRAGRTNVFIHAPIPATRKTHPTERPYSLIEDVLTTFTPEGSRVLVPFLGSGKTLAAAFRLNMTAVGFELSQQYKDSFAAQLEKGEWL